MNEIKYYVQPSCITYIVAPADAGRFPGRDVDAYGVCYDSKAIRSMTATPQDDLVRVMNTPSLYVDHKRRFGDKVVKIINGTGCTSQKSPPFHSMMGVPLMHLPSVGRIIVQISGFV